MTYKIQVLPNICTGCGDCERANALPGLVTAHEGSVTVPDWLMKIPIVQERIGNAILKCPAIRFWEVIDE